MQHKDRFDSLSELFNEAIIIVDQAGVVERANAKAFDLLGAHIAHRPLDNFLRHPDFQDALDAALNVRHATVPFLPTPLSALHSRKVLHCEGQVSGCFDSLRRCDDVERTVAERDAAAHVD